MAFGIIGAYLKLLKGSLTDPEGYQKMSDKGITVAIGYFIVTMLLCCTIAAAINSIPILSLLSGGLQSEYEQIPDFTIADGKFTLIEDAEQPIEYADNFIIDTSGKTTDVPLDDTGDGTLITEDVLISVNSWEEQRIQFKDIEGIVKDKESLVKLIKDWVVVAMIASAIAVFFLKIMSYVIFCGFLIVAFSVLGMAFNKYKTGDMEVERNMVYGIYAQTPVLLSSILAALPRLMNVDPAVSQSVGVMPILIGTVIGAGLFALAAFS